MSIEEIARIFSITDEDARLIRSAIGYNRPIALRKKLLAGQTIEKDLIVAPIKRGRPKKTLQTMQVLQTIN